ncbi:MULTISPECIES: hypothetical protein [Streptomyces]|uniref:hypothetical protein n=1 Tax=Streptomyces TaxID=1883 RepID=UPI0006993EE2|nr:MULTISPECIES: hypothetical protein [Streptomyces]
MPDYAEPDAEPLRWERLSTVCGCSEEDRAPHDITPETGDPRLFPTKPPFLPGWRRPASDIGLQPPAW